MTFVRNLSKWPIHKKRGYRKPQDLETVHFFISNLRIKFYAKWIEFIKNTS
jgi:hypothetical protein